VKRFRIPPVAHAAFVAAMEDVLDLYHVPYDPLYPVVCMDEASKQLVAHVRTPVPARPGRPKRVDDEYKRCGTANVFLAVEPLTGEVVVQGTERRAFVDFAQFVRRLVDDVYPDAKLVRLVMDNLSTHCTAALYEAFEPAEARRIAEKLDIHYTPKHGSWLNMAECQLSVLAREVLDQRIPSLEALNELLDAWRKQHRPTVIWWQFTTDQARTKLHKLYPQLN
jgi:transposase